MRTNRKLAAILIAVIALMGTAIGFGTNYLLGGQTFESKVYDLYAPKDGDDQLIASVGDYQITKGAVYRAVEFDKLAGLDSSPNDTVAQTIDGLITTTVAVTEAQELGLTVTAADAQLATNTLRDSCNDPEQACRQWIDGLLAAGVVSNEDELWKQVALSRQRSMTYTRMFNRAASETLGPNASLDDLNLFRAEWNAELRTKAQIDWHDVAARDIYSDWLARQNS